MMRNGMDAATIAGDAEYYLMLSRAVDVG